MTRKASAHWQSLGAGLAGGRPAPWRAVQQVRAAMTVAEDPRGAEVEAGLSAQEPRQVRARACGCPKAGAGAGPEAPESPAGGRERPPPLCGAGGCAEPPHPPLRRCSPLRLLQALPSCGPEAAAARLDRDGGGPLGLLQAAALGEAFRGSLKTLQRENRRRLLELGLMYQARLTTGRGAPEEDRALDALFRGDGRLTPPTALPGASR